jgi:hypothetical protein
VVENLIIHELVDAILRDEPRNEFVLVLIDAADEIVRDANVDRSVLPARKNVGVEVLDHRSSGSWLWNPALAALGRDGQSDCL